MKRSNFFACLLLLTLLFVLLAGCSSDPPFAVLSGTEMLAQATSGFGHYILTPDKPEDIKVCSRELVFEVGGAEVTRTADIYYPPGFRFSRPKPAIIGRNGSARWSANVSWALAVADAGHVVVLTDIMAREREIYEGQVAALLNQAEELFIDSNRLIFWTSGHGTTLPLTMVMNTDFPWHNSVQGLVCSSPVMQFGENIFQFKPEYIAGDFPVFIATAEKDSFYEVRRSVELFCEAASGIGREVTLETCSGSKHHWMHLDSLSDEAVPDEDAVKLAEEILKFVKKVI